MAHLAALGPDDSRYLDLTDEEALLAEDFAEYHPDGVRDLLAALNLRPRGGVEDTDRVVFDLSIYRATGDRGLATLFGSAR